MALALVLVDAQAFLAQSLPLYRIVNTYALGGSGAWDYVIPDPPNHRLFHRPAEPSYGCR
jgi:hypothetical protein